MTEAGSGVADRDVAASGGAVWLITGTSSGFGRELTRAALERGHRVVATARVPDTIVDLVDDAAGRAHAVRLDVTDAASVREAVAAARAAFGRIDVLVNNAGYGLRGAIEELTDEQLRCQFETNVFGMLAVTRAVLPIMRAQRRGHIVQMSSVGGVLATLGGAGYAGTKFAVEGLSEGLAAELAPFGIGVTIVEPGPFRTDFGGRSIRWAEPMTDYVPVLASARARFDAMDGHQPGDPARAAAAIVAAVDRPDPPLRLPLGHQAFEVLRARLSARLADLDDVEPLGADTDFPREHQ